MSYSLFNVKYIISNFIIVVLYILISSTLLYFASNHKYYHNDFSIVVLIVFFIVIVSSIITTTRRLENYKIDTIKNIDLLLKINEQVIKDIMYKDKSFSTVFFFIFSLSTAVIAYIIETSSEVNFNDFTTVTNVLSHNLFIIVIYNLLFIIYLLFKYLMSYLNETSFSRKVMKKILDLEKETEETEKLEKENRLKKENNEYELRINKLNLEISNEERLRGKLEKEKDSLETLLSQRKFNRK